MQHVNPIEITPGLARYVLAMAAGPSYNGPHAGFVFVDGVCPETLSGEDLVRSRWILTVAQAWEELPDHELVWLGTSWDYVPRKAKPVPSSRSPSIQPPVDAGDESQISETVKRRRPKR